MPDYERARYVRAFCSRPRLREARDIGSMARAFFGVDAVRGPTEADPRRVVPVTAGLVQRRRDYVKLQAMLMSSLWLCGRFTLFLLMVNGPVVPSLGLRP